MEQLDIITIVFFGLAGLVIVLGVWFFVAGVKAFEFDEDPIPCDDMPARYEEFEKAFYNP